VKLVLLLVTTLLTSLVHCQIAVGAVGPKGGVVSSSGISVRLGPDFVKTKRKATLQELSKLTLPVSTGLAPVGRAYRLGISTGTIGASPANQGLQPRTLKVTLNHTWRPGQMAFVRINSADPKALFAAQLYRSSSGSYFTLPSRYYDAFVSSGLHTKTFTLDMSVVEKATGLEHVLESSTGLKLWNGAFWQSTTPSQINPHRRTAVLVHGIFSSVEASFQGHAQRIRELGLYDQVIGINYSWLQPLSQSGRYVADIIRSLRLQNCDVYAHSFGTLATLSAFGQGQDLPVQNLVLIGGPINGSAHASAAELLENLISASANTPWGFMILVGKTLYDIKVSPFMNDLTYKSAAIRNAIGLFNARWHQPRVVLQGGSRGFHSILNVLFAFAPNDGVVTLSSALAQNSGLEAVAGAYTYEENHLGLVGSHPRLQTAGVVVRPIFRPIDYGHGNPPYRWSLGSIPFVEYGVGIRVGDGQSDYAELQLPRTRVRKVHIMHKLSHASAVPDGTHCGQVKVRFSDGSVSQVDLIAGTNTAEWAWERENRYGRMRHRLPHTDYAQWVSGLDFPIRHFYSSVDGVDEWGNSREVVAIQLVRNSSAASRYSNNLGIDVYGVTLQAD